MERLAEEFATWARERVLYVAHSFLPRSRTESEIEHMLAVALFVLGDGVGGGRPRVMPLFEDDIPRIDALGRNVIHFVMQAQFPDWRVDFLVFAYDHTAERWRRLIVECDGHDFHERTKAQAARDRSRDRWAQSQGIAIFRFTGSEIHASPLRCAQDILKWAGWWASPQQLRLSPDGKIEAGARSVNPDVTDSAGS